MIEPAIPSTPDEIERRQNSSGSDWLAGGEMGALIRSFDWSKTPVGPLHTWPQSLRTALGICLCSRFPMAIWWGPEIVQFYNDGYRPFLGIKHPRSLGQRGNECWEEIWDVCGPLYRHVMRTGESTWSADLQLLMDRNGYVEETYFTFAYSPIRGEMGDVQGNLITVTETTERVIGERRLRTLRDLGAMATAAKRPSDACRIAADILAVASSDIPFAALYLLEAEGRQARLFGVTGFERGTKASPETIDLAATDVTGWPISQVVASRRSVVVEDLSRFGQVPTGPWADPPLTAMVLPLMTADGIVGAFVAGISPRRALDDAYRGFVDLLAGQIAIGVANARAYEQERKRAEALAELDRAKTAFFSNVSHEFRTPLTLMLGPLEDELRERPGAPRLEMAHRNSMRLLKLVNTLLDFSRLEAGRMQAFFEPTDLAAVTAELASVFRSAIERAGVRLVVDCPSFPEPVYVDRGMWEKVVLNLMSNALKFTFEGEIEVSLKESGEWRVASGEPSESGEQEVGEKGEGGNDGAELQRSHGMADSDEPGTGVLSRDKGVSPGGTVRPDEPNSSRRNIRSSEHSGGTGETVHQGIPEPSQHRSGVFDGTGDTFATQSAGGATQAGLSESAAGDVGRNQSHAFGAPKHPQEPQVRGSDRSLSTHHSSLTTQRYVTLRVRDTGEGIPAESIPHLFERFYRVQNMRSRTHEGSGIGLALVQELVKLHGGAIRVESEYGTGSSFIVSIPCGTGHLPAHRIGESRSPQPTVFGAATFVAEALRWLPDEESSELGVRSSELEESVPNSDPTTHNSQLAQADSVSNSELITQNSQLEQKRPRVLVADDNADMRDYLRRLLAEQYEVEAAANGEAALAAARARRPDLILSDVMMPRLDGFELLKELRSDEQLKTVPVILLSARAGEESRVEGLHRGADDYLIKPFSARELLARVDAHMNMGRIRRQAEEVVRESEGRFRGMADNAPVMVWVTEPDMSCSFLSKSWYEFTGQTPETGLGSGWLDAVHPDDRETASSALMAANEKRETLRIEYRLRRRDGEYGWAIDSAAPRFGRHGEFLGYIGSVIDITERKRAEETKARLAAIVESSGDAIISKGLDGVITSWNAGAERVFGYTAQETIGRSITILMPPERVDEEAGILQRIRHGERIEDYETVRRRKDGTLLDISLSVSPVVDSAGKIVGASKIARDITGRKRTEEALRRLKDELEARVAERTRELVVSQERLRALATELNLAEQRERRRLAAELHDYLAQLLALTKIKLAQTKQQPMAPSMAKALTDMQDVMDQALTYTRTLVAQLSPPVLHEFGLSSALKWLAEQMKERDLTVALDLKRDIVPLPEDQAVLLFQSVRELLLNVVKHGRTKWAKVTVIEEDGMLRIAVADEGAGFDLAAAAVGGSSESRSAQGFGLFSIRERMAALGGDFSITSAPGQGTTATLALPRSGAGEPSSELGVRSCELVESESPANSKLLTQNSELKRRPTVRVLLVDDHAMVRQGLRGLLDAYTDIAIVGEASTGEEAVALADEVQPDVILMDVNMPGMDGMQSTRRIKQASPAVKVIGLSIQDAEQVETAMKEAGAVAFLNKEAAVDELYQTIRTVWKE